MTTAATKGRRRKDNAIFVLLADWRTAYFSNRAAGLSPVPGALDIRTKNPAKFEIPTVFSALLS